MTGILDLTLKAVGPNDGLALRRPNGDEIPDAPHVMLTGQCTTPKSEIQHDPALVTAPPPPPTPNDCNFFNTTTLVIHLDGSLKGAAFVPRPDGYQPFCINKRSGKTCIENKYSSPSIIMDSGRSLHVNIGNFKHAFLQHKKISEKPFSINFTMRGLGNVSLDPMIPNKPHADIVAALLIGGIALALLFTFSARALVAGRALSARSSWAASIVIGIVFAFAAVFMISEFILN